MHFLWKHFLFTSSNTSLNEWCWCKVCWSVYVVVLFWVTRLVLGSPLHPRHDSHHTHDHTTSCWSLGLQSLHNNYEHNFTLVTSHNCVNTRQECNRMPESNEPKYLSRSKIKFFPLLSPCHSFCLSWRWQSSHVGHVSCWGNWFPSLNSPMAKPSPNFSKKLKRQIYWST